MLRLKRDLGESLIVRAGRDLVMVKLTHIQDGQATLTLRTRRRAGQSIFFTVNGETVELKVAEVRANTALIGVEAPRGVNIVRDEVIAERKARRAALRSPTDGDFTDLTKA